MAETFKVDVNSVCPACTETPPAAECIQCFRCKSVFHAICENTNNDTKLATNTLIKGFHAPSTKPNFKFLCDVCLTKFERSLVDTQTEKIENLENNFKGMESKLNEIFDLLKKGDTSTVPPKSIWHDKERLEGVKAPSPTSVLVVKKSGDVEKQRETQEVVETAIMDNNIPVVETFENKQGDLMVVCEDEDTRDQLKEMVSMTNEEIEVTALRGIRHSVTLVGLHKEYTKEEVVDMLIKQNGSIRKFSIANKIDDHINVHVVKPLKNKATRYQVFCDVSSVLRDGFLENNDRITLGLRPCKVYDRYNIKRCYKCQKFGHYAKECSEERPVCGKCAGDHNTTECQSEQLKCINCVRNVVTDCHHAVSDAGCPSIVNERNKLKNKLDSVRLNRKGTSLPPSR